MLFKRRPGASKTADALHPRPFRTGPRGGAMILSPSQLGTFLRCGEQWRRRYLEGDVIPPGIAARIGSGVHRAAALNWREKLAHGRDLPLDAVQDAAAEAYHAELQNGVFFPPEERSRAAVAMAEGKDTAVRLATVMRNELAPHIHPELIEERVVLDIGLDVPVVTVLDLFTKDKALRDLKTSSRAWTEDKARTSLQPALYRESVRVVTGSYPESIVFDVLVNGKKGAALQSVETTRDEDDMRVITLQFRVMLNSIRAGLFPPAPADSWQCTPRWCGYYHTCPYIPAHRKTCVVM